MTARKIQDLSPAQVEEIELLTLAAKAMGMTDLTWVARVDDYDSPHRYMSAMQRGSDTCATWNPRLDYCDRYTLARSLKMVVDFEQRCVSKRLPDGRLLQQFWGDSSEEEDMACLRLAAEIGRQMP